MAFANPLVFTFGGSGGTAKNLPKINQDAFGSEYFLREATMEWRVKIRHNTENPAVGKLALDRHNVEVTQTIYGTAGNPDTVRYVSLTTRNWRPDVVADLGDLGAGLSFLMSDARYEDLVGWQN